MANILNAMRQFRIKQSKLKMIKSVHATRDGTEKWPIPGSTPSAKKPRRMKMFKHATNVPRMPAVQLSTTWPKIGLIVKIKIQMASAMNGLNRLKSPISLVAGTQTKVAIRHEKIAPRKANWRYTQNMGLPMVPPTGSFFSSSTNLVCLSLGSSGPFSTSVMMNDCGVQCCGAVVNEFQFSSMTN